MIGSGRGGGEHLLQGDAAGLVNSDRQLLDFQKTRAQNRGHPLLTGGLLPQLNSTRGPAPHHGHSFPESAHG